MQRFLVGKPVTARPVDVFEWLWKWARRRPSAAALAAVSVFTALILLLGSLWYGSRLGAAAELAETLRGEAVRQSDLLADHLEKSRHALYSLQLTHVEGFSERNPGLGTVMLRDERYCPPDLRDFTWRYFARACRRKRHDFRSFDLGLVNGIAFAPNGRRLAIGGRGPGRSGRVTLGDPETTEESTDVALKDALGPVHAVAYSPDGLTLATVGGWDEGTRRGSSSSGPRRPAPPGTRSRPTRGRPWPWPSAPTGATWPPRGRTPARKSGTPAGVGCWRPSRATTGPSAASPSPEGDRLATVGDDSTIRIWDPATGERQEILYAHATGIHALAYSPDGSIVATAGEDKVVRLWRLDTRRCVAQARAHEAAVLSLAFHPNGRALASGSKDRLIIFWDLPKLKERARLQGHNHWVCNLAFSPDGKTLASATGDSGSSAVGEVKLWNAVTGQVRATFQGKTAPIAFSPDGRCLVVGNHDATVNVLEAPEEDF